MRPFFSSGPPIPCSCWCVVVSSASDRVVTPAANGCDASAPARRCSARASARIAIADPENSCRSRVTSDVWLGVVSGRGELSPDSSALRRADSDAAKTPSARGSVDSRSSASAHESANVSRRTAMRSRSSTDASRSAAVGALKSCCRSATADTSCSSAFIGPTTSCSSGSESASFAETEALGTTGAGAP